MLQYERIDISEGIDLNKSDKSKECMLCHYWYFKDIGYKYEPLVGSRCHDLLMVVYDLKDFMILNIKGVDHRCYIFNMSTNDAINFFKVGLSPSKKNCVICFLENPLKMMENAFYFILKALFILKIFKFLS